MINSAEIEYTENNLVSLIRVVVNITNTGNIVNIRTLAFI